MAFPSTFADIQSSVIAKARLDPNNAADVSKVKDWINQAYYRICLETECIQASTTQTLTANVSSYALPAAVQRIKYMVAQQQGQTFYGPPLRLTSLDEILFRRKASGGGVVSQGTATMYAFYAPAQIELWPTPGQADTLLIYYVAYPPVLNAGTDLPQIDEPYASELLELGALIDASDYIKDIMAGYIYPQQFQDGMYRLRQHLSRMQGTQSLAFRVPGGDLYPHDNSVDTGVS